MAKPRVQLPPPPAEPEFEPGPITQQFNLEGVVEGLVQDLALLRAGKISVKEAQVRGELGKQVLRGVGLILQGNRFMEARSKLLPPPTAESEPEGPAAEAHPAKVPPLKRNTQFGRGARRPRVVDVEAE